MRGSLLRLVSALALGGAGCGVSPAADGPDPNVHILALPEVAAPELPDAPGRAMFYGACSTCHTTRYVLDQPPLSRRLWTAEVDKMRHAYGAPFPAEMAPSIVEYLASVHGAAD